MNGSGYFDRLEDEEDKPAIQILVRMIEAKVTARWSATKCLAHGFTSRLFKRWAADGLVACASDRDDFDLLMGDFGSKTPIAAPSSSDSACGMRTDSVNSQ
jgi:hypothetical protein